jgi:hypothetical protein
MFTRFPESPGFNVGRSAPYGDLIGNVGGRRGGSAAAPGRVENFWAAWIGFNGWQASYPLPRQDQAAPDGQVLRDFGF